MSVDTPRRTGTAAVWSDIGRVPAHPSGGIFTIAGRAFCVSGRSGNIAELGPQGFFSNDTRFLSGLHLLVNGVDPEVVDATSIDADEAVFFLRSRAIEQDEHAEPGLVVRRHRYQGSTLHEDIIIENRSGGPASVTVELEVSVDFADVFDVRRAGPATERPVSARRANGELVFSYSSNGFERATEITTSEDAFGDGSRLVLSRRVEPNDVWKTCVDIVPVIDGSPMPIERSCTTGHHAHSTPAAPRQFAHPPQLRSSADALEHLWAHSLSDLAALEIRMDGQRVFAAGIPWFVALFGRDSVITSIEAMLLDREAALGTAQLLADLQGTKTDPSVSEEPGKILHEVRFGERSLPHDLLSRYYGAVDTTPLWCMLLDKLHRWGANSARLAAMLPNLRAAVGWIRHGLEAGDGFLTYRGDVTRLDNQGWKDSGDSMVDGRGRQLDQPIAVVEAQGYAVAAFRSAARLEIELGEPARAASLRLEADELQQRIDDRFWRDDLGTFALAIGNDGWVADTVSSNPGHLLWAEAVRPERAAQVAKSLTGNGLWSGWGIRTLTRDNPAYHPVSYHRGSVWPHDTMLAVAGLISYGHLDEALMLVGGLLAASPHFSYELPELFSGISRDEVPHPVGYPTSSSPQAWAAAVPIYLTEQLLGIRPDLPAGRVEVAPRLPDGIELRLDGLRLGNGVLSLRAEGRRAQFLEVPPGIDVVVR
ncbi:MAG: glycogen debranching N-terminal domain-containing protein [Acidimicrobiia bacterium]